MELDSCSQGMFLPTGAYTDPETGLQYLINRYYDPATAQFLTVDPLVGLTQSPYGYVYDNPLNATDPTGLGCGWTSPWDCAGSAASAVVSGAETVGGAINSVRAPVAHLLQQAADVTGTFGAATSTSALVASVLPVDEVVTAPVEVVGNIANDFSAATELTGCLLSDSPNCNARNIGLDLWTLQAGPILNTIPADLRRGPRAASDIAGILNWFVNHLPTSSSAAWASTNSLNC